MKKLTNATGGRYVAPQEQAAHALLLFSQSEHNLTPLGVAAARGTFSNFPHKEARRQSMANGETASRSRNASEIARFTCFTPDERLHYADEIEEGLKLARQLIYKAFGELSRDGADTA